MTVVESPKGRASHNLGNRGAIPPFPPPGYCYIFFQNLSRKESSSPPAPSLFRLILRLEKTRPALSSRSVSGLLVARPGPHQLAAPCDARPSPRVGRNDTNSRFPFGQDFTLSIPGR